MPLPRLGSRLGSGTKDDACSVEIGKDGREGGHFLGLDDHGSKVSVGTSVRSSSFTVRMVLSVSCKLGEVVMEPP